MDAWTQPHDLRAGWDAQLRLPRAQVAVDASVEEIGPRHKGFAPSWEGSVAQDVARRQTGLFSGEFTSPVLVLNTAAATHNMEALATYCADRGLRFAPHVKTTMSPQLIQAQISSGAWALTCATVHQARILRTFGVTSILIANPLVSPADLDWVWQETARHPELAIRCYVDSVESAVLLAAAAPPRPSSPMEVLVEFGYQGGRTGARGARELAALTTSTQEMSALSVVGFSTFEGTVADPTTLGSRGLVESHLVAFGEAAAAAWSGVRGPRAPILSAGGSYYFDLVARVLTDRQDCLSDAQVVIRSGEYVVHDPQPSASWSPFALDPTGGSTFQPALELWSRVLATPEPGLAILDFGKRDTSSDVAMPLPRWSRPASLPPKISPTYGIQELAGAEVFLLNDQHAYLRFPVDGALVHGDWVGLQPAHPCTTMDRWHLIPTIGSGHTVTGYIETCF